MFENDNIESLLHQIQSKYDAIDQKTETQLQGLLYSKPINYWDYIQTDALLNLQVQRTVLPDEMVFIMYHQINELLFKMILWETNQIADNKEISVSFFTEKLQRVNRYVEMLVNSFSVMGDGMEVAQYLKFRNTLTPASGFQSAQFRLIEFASTDLKNLIAHNHRVNFDESTPIEQAFEKLYWQAAGKNHQTGEKLFLILEFEKKYKSLFIDAIKVNKEANIWQKFKQLPLTAQENQELKNAMRDYDYMINIKWVLQHLNTAKKYIQNQEATGGSDWQKYMHPKYQRRIFFPELWSETELRNWGLEENESI
jgi:tryptophan 2,3-dioxygenase